jgi:predicted TIM-barrel fold metal-dependent hydrolase
MPPRIDCDVHAVLEGIEPLLPFLPAYWREQVEQTGFRGPEESWYPVREVAASAALADTLAPTLERVRADVLGGAEPAALAILNSDYAVETLHNPDAAAAVASAVNEWLAAEWLAPEPRLRASIVVASQFPELAAAEIDRMADRAGFVQVLLPARSEAPYGSRNFRPLFAAAARHGLPVCLHFGGAPGNASTPVGWPSFFAEEYAGMSGVFQTQLISLVAGGVFDAFRDLRLVLAEAGVSWVPSLLWRFDKNWKGLRREVPWVRRPPSDYVWEHVRLTTAPFDAPPDPAQLRQVVEQLGSEEILLYASDYPHHHGEEPGITSLEFLPEPLRTKVLAENARRVYRL